MKLLIALALLGVVCARDYEYRSGGNKKASSDNYRNGYNVARDPVERSEEIPDGYDYVLPQSGEDFAAGGRKSDTGDALNSASLLQNAASAAALLPVALPVIKQQEEEVYPPATYDFSYSVHDETTGDIKEHSESRDGYTVRGSYSLVDPDGYKRIVTYTADDVHGFNAVVKRIPYELKTLAVATTDDLDERAPLSVSRVSVLKSLEENSSSAASSSSSSSSLSTTSSTDNDFVGNRNSLRDSYNSSPRGRGRGRERGDSAGGPYA